MLDAHLSWVDTRWLGIKLGIWVGVPMKVPIINGLISIAKSALDQKHSRVGKTAGVPAGADKVELSSQVLDLSKVADAGKIDSAQRAALVTELKAMYERGELKAEPQAIAEVMVEGGLFDDLLHATGKQLG